MGFNINGLLDLIDSQSAQEERDIFKLTKDDQISPFRKLAENTLDRDTLRTEIAKVLAAEAANQGERGMIAVANTINNRSINRKQDLMTVISSPNQYYGYTAKNKDDIYAGVKDLADSIAEKLINGELEDITDGAEYFLLPNEGIRAWHGDMTTTIGDHTFYRESKKK
jgi:spore germination cell wall hydrolase CwlJ-like protein